MRVLLPVGVIVLATVISGAALAQDEDQDWAEITNLMNGLTAANQQLGRVGAQWTPGTQWPAGTQWLPGGAQLPAATQLPFGAQGLLGATKLSPQEAQALAQFAQWCQLYAQALQSIDAFGDEDAPAARTPYRYPSKPPMPALPGQPYNGAQTLTPDLLRMYQYGMQFGGE